MEYLKLKLWTLLWKIFPRWLGTFLHRKYGILFGGIFDHGKPIKFYFQRERPKEFSVDTWHEHDDVEFAMKNIALGMGSMPWKVEPGGGELTEIYRHALASGDLSPWSRLMAEAAIEAASHEYDDKNEDSQVSGGRILDD